MPAEITSTESSAFPGPEPPRSSKQFDYQAWAADVLAPIVPVRLVGPNGSVINDSGIIDTGADSSGFPLWMMKRFGISTADCEQETFETSGGDGEQWIWDGQIMAEIAGIKVGLSAIFSDTPMLLLGRDDFLSAFRVSFDQRSLCFSLEPY